MTGVQTCALPISSLTHCGLGSFGVLLAVAGASTTTIQWLARLEPVFLPAGYGLIVLALLARARALALGPVAAVS